MDQVTVWSAAAAAGRPREAVARVRRYHAECRELCGEVPALRLVANLVACYALDDVFAGNDSLLRGASAELQERYAAVRERLVAVMMRETPTHVDGGIDAQDYNDHAALALYGGGDDFPAFSGTPRTLGLFAAWLDLVQLDAAYEEMCVGGAQHAAEAEQVAEEFFAIAKACLAGENTR